MASRSSEVADAILQSVQHGGYPESEDVVSADLSTDMLPSLLGALSNARKEVNDEVRQLSREAAPDVDGWIAQAKQLQADIERSKATAREIVSQAEASNALQVRMKDASSKVDLLRGELDFNETLSNTLDGVRRTAGLMNDANADTMNEKVLGALDKLDQIDSSIPRNRSLGNTRVADLLQNRSRQLRNTLKQETLGRWNNLVTFDHTRGRLSIKNSIQDATTTISIEDVATALVRLDILDNAVGGFRKDFGKIARVYFAGTVNGRGASLALQSHASQREAVIEKGDKLENPRVEDVLGNIITLTQWLIKHLPSKFNSALCNVLLPPLVSQIIKDWLDPAIPISLADIEQFESVLESVSDAAESIGNLGWAGKEGLVDWVDAVPKTWLTKRRERALDAARRTLLRGLHETKVVERVETQMVANDDIIQGERGEQENDEWDAGWEDEDAPGNEMPKSAKPTNEKDDDDDDDTSAWDVEEDPESSKTVDEQQSTADSSNAAEDDDAWGWEDDDQASPNAARSPAKVKKTLPYANGAKSVPISKEREVTLKETLTVTAVPDGIFEIVSTIVNDAEGLMGPGLSQSSIRLAAAGLCNLPTLIFAMYRATAAAYYANLSAGNMLIYNDSARLAEQLRSLRPSDPKTLTKLKLEVDIKALEGFSKRAYSKEMESQRTILRDLLDGAQGFANCTVPPFAAECDNAVSMTVDRVREVAREWGAILSHSALLQSIGSLVSTVLSKVIVDVEDMSDISEEESKRLRHFCDEISKLSDLFTQRHPNRAEEGDMTAVYVHNWFKFQFLSEILESSLADIRYLWREAELKLEFQPDEIVDLIEALFSESEHRRKAISEIRKSASG
ncbi:MAG: hypothetical protein M1820_000317 [Bogoriella megaspora]|nr:MAG: hypothetical protein M1820_000317 [Bogoriella megaspora]